MTEKRDALVGVVIVMALVVITLGTLWLEGSSFSGESEPLYAIFEEAGQIRPGNPLKFRGVRVGRVRDVQVLPDGSAVKVEFRVQEGFELPPDAVVVLSPESFFGDWQAEIHPRGRFPGVTYKQPTEPGVLPGYALPDISQLTAAADRISENLAELTERVGIAFSDETAQNIASLIRNVEGVTDRLGEMVDQQAASFLGVTEEVQRVAQGVGDAADEAREGLARVNAFLARAELVEALEDFAALSSSLRTLGEEMQGTNTEVRAMVARAEASFVALERVAVQLNEGDGTLSQLLKDPEVAEGLEGTLAELRVLLEDIRENPRRYLRLSIF
jgi:phospholipid/cholesterol/gamma-HCH transport system substrate-binding protein